MPEFIDPKSSGNGASAVAREMALDDDRSIREWMDQLAGDGSIRVQITRKKPSVGPGGEAIAGILETVEDRVDDEYLRDTWGGGVFQLKVFKLNAGGNWTYLRARTISIAGPPKMSGVVLGGSGASPGSASLSSAGASGSDELVDRAMSALERSTQRAEARMERLEAERARPGLDTSTLDTLIAPMRDELSAAREEARELRARLYEASNRPPPRDEFRDKLMERMIDGESQRVESIRVQYEARLDRLRDAHQDEVRRIEARHEDALKRLERQHERTVEGQEKALDERTAAMKLGYEMRIDALRGQIATLEREIAERQAKVATLEARKDQSLPDKAAELMQIREALEGLGGAAGAAAGDRPWYERALDALGNSQALLALVDRVGGGGAGAPQEAAGQPAPQIPPPGVPFRGPDGRVYMIGPDGKPHLVPQRALAARARRARLAQGEAEAPQAPQGRTALRAIPGGKATPRVPESPAAAAPADQVAGTDQAAGDEDALADEVAANAGVDGAELAEPGEPVRAPDAKEVKIAVTFLENAVRNGVAPEQFASAFRTLVPADVLRFIRAVGIDQFLNTVVETSSPLATQRGRTFARNVSRILIEGA